MIPKYARNLLLLSAATILAYEIYIVFASSFNPANDRALKDRRGKISSSLSLPSYLRIKNFTYEQVNKMSSLGRWLLSPEGSVTPLIASRGTNPFIILVWKHGPFLERRHFRRFTSKTFSPWEGCSVQNCLISYNSSDLRRAHAVLFHLHLTGGRQDLPRRRLSSQRWVFLTDESPAYTFLRRRQRLSDYNGLFNWSMTYRTDSDVPVPYGRTLLTARGSTLSNESSIRTLEKKSKLVAVMGSNCGGSNGRWNYVRALRTLLGSDLDIFGSCVGGNSTACPGHFTKDCGALDAYKFYLAFENSNCKEYLTEKVFWNAYEKTSVPVIMGAPRSDCERLLPPRSFIHVGDFADPAALVERLRHLHLHDEEYLKYHEWRGYYRVINEHGYFGSASKHYCRLCEALNYNSPQSKSYDDLDRFWSVENDCTP